MPGKIWIKCIAAAAVLAGVALAAYPAWRDWSADREQVRLTGEWRQAMALVEQAPEWESTPENAATQESSSGEPTEGGGPATAGAKYEVVGMLRIPSIGLELPLLAGTNEQTLNLGVSTVNTVSLPGMPGNFSIAGHNSRRYGRKFNRLHELKAGDVIEVDTGSNCYRYLVEESFLVLPEDMSVLESSEAAEITLITCQPVDNPTHRLIVRGLLEQPSSPASSAA